MNTYIKSTQKLSGNSNEVESQKPKTKNTNIKANEQCTKLKQKQQCASIESE
jgi:hypothetical protein